MSVTEQNLLFDDETGCLTAFALQGLVEGSLGELERLEVTEHLSYCDLCVERYTALLADDTLLEAPELLKQSVLTKLRQRMARAFVNRYFHMGVAACLTLVLWSTGVFATFGELALSPPRLEHPNIAPEKNGITISQRLEDFSDGIGSGLYRLMDRMNTIDLRGVFANEKE
ncbi:MAG: hypothetical protein HFF11_03110 [Angelakisella sp.]|jgi:hypothetical protein|nr:hypothetical protein [Angelakisella sp.]